MLNHSPTREYWRLDAMVMRFYRLLLGCALAAISMLLLALIFAPVRGEFLFLSSICAAVGGGVLLRTIRIWRRLDELDRFIP